MNQPFISDHDIHLFNEGRYFRLYDRMGAHALPGGGVHFAVWAPNAKSVSVIGTFNHWDNARHYLEPRGQSGLWTGVIPEAKESDLYKYHIVSHNGDYTTDRADPVGFLHETPPKTASIVKRLSYNWQDSDWMQNRGSRQNLDRPMSVYELHLGSWRSKVEDYNRPLTYVEMADELVSYIAWLGFTHVEFMPVMEHPFGGSWGYQLTGYFAPTHRYGEPEELMLLIDKFHQAGIGVILDWVPSHFPEDRHGLAYFDGTHLYEHADPQQGFHPDWKSCVFNYGRNEVRSFLISNAFFWFDKYHVDALRVDAVASMIYRDYSRNHGEWTPNIHGGRENLEAIHFLRELNSAVYGAFPDIHMIAEESTAFPKVSRPVHDGGLGFGMKWDMGWMHDTLRYFQKDPVYRGYHQNDLTFRTVYAYHENFMLPLSHDEVVHGKGSLINKMGGDEWQKFASLRAMYGYMYATPGKKLLFMGGEFGQWKEWNHNISLDWHEAGFDRHHGVKKLMVDLNKAYRQEPALSEDFSPIGFEWVDASDHQKSVLSFLRKSADGRELVLCIFNFSGQPYPNYHIGVPKAGNWIEIINTDARRYGGGGHYIAGNAPTHERPLHGRPYSVRLSLPACSAIYLKWKA